MSLLNLNTAKVTVLMTGGIDSTACAHLLGAQGLTVRGLFIDHGQAAALPERNAVVSISAKLGVPLSSYTVSGGEPFLSGELVGRNAFLISAALFLTRSASSLIAIAVHDGTSYYDCSASFIDSMAALVAEQTDGSVALVAPFRDWTKCDILRYFTSCTLPLELTYSCERGFVPPCGTCKSCQDRRILGC